MAAKKERTLRSLPDYGTPLPLWRDWLTKGLSPTRGHRVHSFLRHGRQRTDACTLVLIGPEEKPRSFDIEEQRLLSTPASMRATLVSATDGLVRPERLTQAELEDIWIALVTLATVTAHQSQKDETREWLEATVEQAVPLTGHSLSPPKQVDGIQALLARDKFDYLRARRFLDAKEADPPRPTLLIDNVTGERWIRVGDLATFWRHVLGVGVMSQPTIDGRLSAIGIKRHEYAHKDAQGSVRRVRLYRVADGKAAK